MKLIGSKASPFVRRIRLQLADRPYDFEVIDIFSEEGQRRLNEFTPTARIPVLIDGETVIWDSLLITQHLSSTSLPLETLKQLILVNELSDAGIQLFQLRKFGTDPGDESPFSKNNLRRIQQILALFESQITSEWNLLNQWLFCTLDWMDFRNIVAWQQNHPRLNMFWKSQQTRSVVQFTNPR